MSEVQSPPSTEAVQKIREQLNNAKVLGPLIAAVFVTHGSADDAAFAAAHEHIGSTLEGVVNAVLDKVAPHGCNASLRASTTAALSPLVAEAWKRQPGKEHYLDVAQGFLRLVTFVEPDPGMVFNDTMARATNAALAEARALSKILPTIFKLQQLEPTARKLYLSGSVEHFQELCRNDIRALATTAADHLSLDDARQRNISYRSALNCISEVYAEALAESCTSLTSELHKIRKGSPEERKAFLTHAASSPEGPLPERYRERVRHLVEELLYPQDDPSPHGGPEC